MAGCDRALRRRSPARPTRAGPRPAGEVAALSAILCAVDFSEQSGHALRWAAALAAARGMPLAVVGAVDPLLHEAARVRAGLDLAQAEVQPALRAFAADVIPPGAAWAPAITFDVPVGEPADAILEAARRHGAGLVVMGTQGLGGFRKLLLGSTAERVLRQTRTPVLAVPAGAAEDVVVDAAGARLNLRRILVATDFSEPADAALRWAVEAARAMAIPLVLAHVVHEPDVPAQWRAYAAQSDEDRIAAARTKLTRLAHETCAPVPCEIAVAIGRAAEALPALAQEHQAGLIVAGLARDAGALARRPGSIAYPVLCLARVPVLVVPGAAAGAQA